MKVIFLLNRYGNLIGQSIFTLEELGILSGGSIEVSIPVYLYKNLGHTIHQFCERFPWFIAFFGLFSQESIHSEVLHFLRLHLAYIEKHSFGFTTGMGHLGVRVSCCCCNDYCIRALPRRKRRDVDSFHCNHYKDLERCAT